MIAGDDFDIAAQRFASFLREHPRGTNYNEANTRLKVIDEIFFSCLGWTKTDVSVEVGINSGYADYLFSTTRKVFIAEAKKEGSYFELPTGDEKKVINIRTLIKKNDSLSKAISQVQEYCQHSGVPYALITNGHQFFGFIASRTDGQSPEDGKAIIFPSLESIDNDFVSFWNYFSKTGLENHNMKHLLLGRAGGIVPQRLSQTLQDYPGTQHRNPLQHDLNIVSEIILEDLTHESLEKKFLEDCYCESGALSRHSLLAKNIIESRYAQLETRETGKTQILKARTKAGVSNDLLTQAISRRPILLLGDVGVGKSTFIRKLIKIDAKNFFHYAIAIHVDLGSKTILSLNVKDAILKEIVKVLDESYKFDLYDDEFVRSIYREELKKFAKGINKDLQTIDKKEYKKREIDYLQELEKDTASHISSAMNYIVNKRQKQVVIFLDNADQRDINDQQTVFLASQEIAENWPVTVFVSLRPETFNISNQEGVLKAYHAKAFTIDPPRMDKVLVKRLEFGVKLSTGKIPVPSLDDSGLKLDKLSVLLSVMIMSLNSPRNRELPSFIENIAAGNVREAIDMVKDFFGSGHINTEKILRISENDKDGESYIIKLHEFLRAVIYDDNKYFDPKSSIITNIFDVNTDDEKELFLTFIIITLLEQHSKTSKNKGFVSTDVLYSFLQSAGFLPEQIDQNIAGLIRRQLVETEEMIVIKKAVSSRSVRPTSSGLCHVKILCGTFAYIDAVVIDVPIFRKKFKELVFDESSEIRDRVKRAKHFVAYLDTVFRENFNSDNIGQIADDWNIVCRHWESDIQRVEGAVARISQPVNQVLN